MAVAPPLLTAAGLQIGYRLGHNARRALLDDLRLEIRPGELICLLGANGAGKTTLLRVLAGMIAPLAGEIQLQGRPLATYPPAALARLRSIVLTERTRAPLMSGGELVALGRHPYTDWRGRLTEADRQAIARAIQWVGGAALAERPFAQLSDGEQQKLLIARALAQQPRLMLLDEPTAFLDLPRRVEIMQMLRRISRQAGCAILLATHDLDSALRVADRFWVIDGDGNLASDIPEQLVLSGQLERAFRDTTLAFNYSSGAFEDRQKRAPPLVAKGQGRDYDWTLRALRRLGYAVVKTSNRANTPSVSVSENGAASCWRWQYRGDYMEFDRLAPLLYQITAAYPIESPEIQTWQNQDSMA